MPNHIDPDNITVIGVYRAEISSERRSMTLEWKPASQLKEELRECVLIELLLSKQPDDAAISRISCGDQAAWLDCLLTADGDAKLDAHTDVPCRLTFYLHYCRIGSTIQLWGDQQLIVESVEPLPIRLHELNPYEAVD